MSDRVKITSSYPEAQPSPEVPGECVRYDPVADDFPEPRSPTGTTLDRDFPGDVRDVVETSAPYAPKEGWTDLGAPPPEDTPTGLDLLKLWVRQYEAGQRLVEPPQSVAPCFWADPRDLAAVIGVWEAERAAKSEAEVGDGRMIDSLRAQLEQANERARSDRAALLRVQEREEKIARGAKTQIDTANAQAEAAQARCDAAQSRLVGERANVAALQARETGLHAQLDAQAETIRAFQEATGLDEAPSQRVEGIEEIRPARDAERLTVLSSGSVEKIAEEVADRIARRMATPTIEAALHALRGGAAGAAKIIEAARRDA